MMCAFSSHPEVPESRESILMLKVLNTSLLMHLNSHRRYSRNTQYTGLEFSKLGFFKFPHKFCKQYIIIKFLTLIRGYKNIFFIVCIKFFLKIVKKKKHKAGNSIFSVSLQINSLYMLFVGYGKLPQHHLVSQFFRVALPQFCPTYISPPINREG